MNMDYGAALAARDGLWAGNRRAAGAEPPAVGLRMWGPAGFTVYWCSLITIY